MTNDDLRQLLVAFGERQLLVVGDLMLDEYLWCEMERLSAEAPCPIVDLIRTDRIVGGAGNVARNARHLGSHVRVLGVVGTDATADTVIASLAHQADVSGLLRDGSRPTSLKTRILARSNQILRIDHESRQEISRELEEQVLEALATMPKPDAVVLSDYGKGFLTDRVLRAVLDQARAWEVPSVVDPKGRHYGKYAGCTAITPNKKEAEIATGMELADGDSIATAAARIREIAGCRGVVITRGPEGMTVLDDSLVEIPTEAREVFDVTGAGDTVCSVIALALASGLSLTDAARVANTAAGIVVEKVGTSWVTPQELLDRQQHAHPYAKIQQHEQLLVTVSRLKSLGRRIVFTNGCFDLLHVGHIKYLAAARARGDVLIVGLNSDASVSKLKGDKRPLIGQSERAHLLAALEAVDFVTVFDDLTPETLIGAIRPDVLVKGGDYTVDRVVGRAIVDSYGGRVEIVPLEPGASTSSIVQTIVERYRPE